MGRAYTYVAAQTCQGLPEPARACRGLLGLAKACWKKTSLKENQVDQSDKKTKKTKKNQKKPKKDRKETERKPKSPSGLKQEQKVKKLEILSADRGVTETKKGCADPILSRQEPKWAKMGQEGSAEGRDRADPGYPSRSWMAG